MFILSEVKTWLLFLIIIIAVGVVLPKQVVAQDWLTAYNNSVALYNDNATEKALVEAERAEQLYRKQYDINHNNYRSILRQLSVLCYDLNKITNGISYAGKEVSSWRKTVSVDEASYIDALDILGVLFSANYQYDSAIIVLQEAVNIAEVTTTYPPADKAIKGCHLADAFYGSGNVEQSYIQFSKSLKVLEQEEELPAEYLSFCYSYGNASVELKEYQTGIHYLTTMLEYYPPEYDHNPEVIDALIDLGKANTELTEYQVGVDYYKTALERLPTSDAATRVIITKLLADNLERQGKHQESQSLLDKIGESVEIGSNQAALLLTNKATVLLNNNEANSAVQLFDSALYIIKSNEPIDYLALGNISYNTATAYRSLGNTEKALELYVQALESLPETSVAYQKSMIGSARLLLTIGRNEEAAKGISKINLSKKNEWRATEVGAVYNGLAGYYQAVGNYNMASNSYKEALMAVPAKTNAQLYNNIAFNYMSLLQASGKFKEAEQLLANIENELKSSDPYLQFKFLQSTGNLYHSKGNLAEAEKQYAKALSLAGTTYGENSNEYADILLRQATLAKDKGDYNKSEPLFNKALAIVDNKSLEAGSILNNMGILFQQMGRLEEAQKHFEMALAIYSNNDQKDQLAYALTEENLATLYSQKGDIEKALQLLEESVALNASIYGKESPNYAISLHNYASLLQKNKELDKAKILFQEAMAIQFASFGENHPSYANTLHNLAILAEDEKDYVTADSLLQKVIDIRGKLYDENHPSYTAALFSRAVLKQQMGDFELAKIDFDKVAGLYLNQIIKYFPSLSETEKTAFYKKITPVFNRYKEFLLEYYVNNKQEEDVLGQLYNIQIATKAILLNSVNKTRKLILSSGDTELIANFDEWRKLKEQLAAYYTYSKARLAEEGVDLDGFEELINEKERQLSSASEIFANEFDKNEVVWQTVQSKLKADQIGIELIRIARNSNDGLDSVSYIALAINPSFTSPKLVIYPNGKTLERKYLAGYNNSIALKRIDNYSYNAFWKPLEKLTSGYKTIYLSPDGVFNKINANSLFNLDQNLYLNTSQNVRYISSTRDLLTEKTASLTNSAILVANPFYPNSIKLASNNLERSYNFGQISQLPATKVEAESISKLMKESGWQVQVLSEKEAQKKTIIEASPKLIHIAAHGFFLNEKKDQSKFLENPLFRSGLLLAGAGDANQKIDNAGVLTAYEVMNMNLDQTELVVLSACETALGDIQNGEGVYGLQRAFIVAGANTLIMSLWKVDDNATQKLMSAFYGYWLTGMEKHEALQKAQIELQKEYEYPYYWGAFIMIGI